MEKGLARATGEQILGSQQRSHQQAVPPPSSTGRSPALAAAPHPPRLSLLLFSPHLSPATEHGAVRCILYTTEEATTPRTCSPDFQLQGSSAAHKYRSCYFSRGENMLGWWLER